jgi:hydroxymethylpyrimidine/phosphomethylpyrimidine kinase
MDRLPTVLCIGGHDPTGGAGLQADIETLAAHRVRAFTLVTCLTAQDTRNVQAIWSTPIDAFRHQARALLGDVRPDAIKIGLLGSREIAVAAAEIAAGLDAPMVLDPVLAAGGGAQLSDTPLIDALRAGLLPQARLVLPNRAELFRLAAADEETAAAREVLARGAAAVLVTGADAAAGSGDDQVSNTLYTANMPPREWNWPRLPGVYHGSGCTLASACAAALACGTPLEQAVDAAQRFTLRALEQAEAVGAAQRLPTRLK